MVTEKEPQEPQAFKRNGLIDVTKLSVPLVSVSAIIGLIIVMGINYFTYQKQQDLSIADLSASIRRNSEHIQTLLKGYDECQQGQNRAENNLSIMQTQIGYINAKLNEISVDVKDIKKQVN
ncbi:MAG: hypothetical protein RBT65_19445 [Methanolobus sp.]|nr:hypothetical protein [Methanolobus sp.]